MSHTGAIVLYAVIGSLGMAVMDSVGTVLVRAINAGRGNLAGFMDAVGDLAKISILSVAATRLTSDYGAWGWLGIVPILLTGFFVTRHATILSQRIEDEDDAEENEARDAKIRELELEMAMLRVWKEAQRQNEIRRIGRTR
jgi:uncharacterized membrane protein YjfL (UPF0719 family)